MSGAPASLHPAYFGKLPSRGDFVRSSGDSQLLAPLDRWLSRTMELLSEDARWKLLYDALPPVDFAFLGARSRLAIAGHLAASRDASERRFPFMAAISLETADPLAYVSNAPALLATVWTGLGARVGEACGADDPTPLLQRLVQDRVDTAAAASLMRSSIHDFLLDERCGALEARLSAPGRQVDLRRLMLALGILLRPLSTTPGAVIARGLDLPLPADASMRNTVATLWMHLIGGFLRRSSLELQLLLAPTGGQMRMIVGFQGASAQSLASVFDARISDQHNIRIDDPAWVEAHTAADYGIAKLASYLSQPGLPLERAVATFREVFLGE